MKGSKTRPKQCSAKNYMICRHAMRLKKVTLNDYQSFWKLLAAEAISRNEYEGNVRISLPEIIDDLMIRYQSGENVELLSIISEQYDSYILENFG